MQFKWIVALAMLLVGNAWAGSDNTTFTLVYSGNQDGELEPCGCSVEGDLGGILRQSTMLKKLRQENPGMFAVSSGGLISSMSAQDKLTGEYILKGYSQLGYDAIGMQWSDLAYGHDFTQSDALPWVSSNDDKGGFKFSRKVERNGVALHVFSWLDPDQDPQAAMHNEKSSPLADTTKLIDALQTAQSQGGLTLLSTSFTLAQAQEQLPLEYVDILLIRSAYEVYGEPQNVGHTLVLQPGSRGMRLGYASITLDSDGRIGSYRHKQISMPNEIADDETLRVWYDDYNAKVKENYEQRAALRKAMETGESPYAGEATCQSCHSDEHAVWQKSLHAEAFYKLEDVSKSFDPNCVQCHTVGFETSGGFIDIDATPDLINVQCENCHGAAHEHVKSRGATPVKNSDWQPQQMCAQCHVQKHSPSFKFDTYWPRIKHGAK